MRHLSLTIIFALLTGCSSKEYYQALEAQYKAFDPSKQQAVQLVNHSWTETDSTSHTLIVNQPRCSGDQPKIVPIPAPWQGAYKFYDHTLGTAERFLPWLAILSGGGGGRSDSSTTYTMGNNSTVVTTQGDSSPVDYQAIPFLPEPEVEAEVPAE